MRRAGARHRKSRHRVGEFDRLEWRIAARQRHGEGAVEGIARARRFGHGRECLRRAKLGYFFRVQQRALGAEGNDRRADAFLQQLVAGVSRLADDSDRHAGQVSGLGFIRREIIAKRKGRRVQLRRRCRI